MSGINKSLDVQNFYPKQLEIAQIEEKEHEINIRIFARTQKCACPKCGTVSGHHHGTYSRKIQDLPILGKTTWLLVNAYEYQCDNPNCDTSTFAESCEGFLNYYSRMTERCEDLVCTLALETSCEGCARICRNMNLKTSGDSIIRLLVRRFSMQPQMVCGETIGVDDFAFKKRNTYGTIIVDEKTHKPIAILQGRDGNTLKEWLSRNKHVKTVTRDRASAYSSAIQEILPDAMQVADRFHLHQNLLAAVKDAVNSVIPVDIKVPIDGEDEDIGSVEGKKNHS